MQVHRYVRGMRVDAPMENKGEIEVVDKVLVRIKGPGVLRIGVAFSNLGLITLTSTASQISQIWSITGRFNNGTGVTGCKLLVVSVV